jgi:hypothetical protein
LVSRALRLTLGIAAWLAISVAAFLLIDSEQQIRQHAASLRSFDQHAREATDALTEARVAQQAYVAAGQGVAFWTAKETSTAEIVTAALGALRGSAGAGARTAIDEAAATAAEFDSIDKRVRDYLKSGQQLMAADVIFTEGSEAAATASRQIETARLAEHQAVDVSVAAIRGQQTLTAGIAAGIVGIIVLLLIPVRRAAAVDAGIGSGLSIAPAAASAPVAAAALSAPPTWHEQGSVFKAATDVATDLGRVRDLDELTRVLGRAAEVMDASGLMVWIGSPSGGDLRPVLSHGYSAQMVARIPPVARTADNAAAAAYRSGTLQIVMARPGSSSGAVVAPILAADGCIGALSAEIRSGGEASESVQALAAIFASHLAGVLASTPAEITEPKAATQA